MAYIKFVERDIKFESCKNTMFRRMKTTLCSLVAGTALFFGCASTPPPPKPEPAFPVDLKKLDDMLDSLVRMISYHDGRMLMTHRDYEGAAQKFTRAIKEKDNAMYRIARFRANINLAQEEPTLQERNECYETCHADADAYIKFLPNEPDGYIAKALTIYKQSRNAGVGPLKLNDAEDLMQKAKTLIHDHKKQLVHFNLDGVNALYRRLHHAPRDY